MCNIFATKILESKGYAEGTKTIGTICVDQNISLKMVRIVYLDAFIETNENKNNGQIDVTLETCIVLFLLKFLDQPSDIQIHLIPLTEDSKTNFRFSIQRDAFDFIIIETKRQFQLTAASQCNFPVFMSEENVIIAGLCGVCRALIKASDPSFRYLLGFKESCLLAPAEASSWTKFCEIDMIKATKQILHFHHQTSNNKKCIDIPIKYQLPIELACFESHMNQPVRVHNIQKFAQNLAKQAKKNGNTIDPMSTIIEHKYVEDLEISIADILLFPNFHFIMNACKTQSSNAFNIDLPLTIKWINTVKHHPKISSQCLSILNVESMIDIEPKLNMEYIINNVDKFSLYKHDPKHYKSKNRTFTRQENIDRSLKKINGLGIEFTSKPIIIASESNDLNTSIDWETVPFAALPDGGNLPEKRLQRKKDQLNGLASEIIKIARNRDCIVDFCSGAGHLGILLAYLLPSCKIYLLENKEESLMRAKQRVQQLQLTNVQFFQCNLDYFIGRFDIGTSLHACGIASDIVLLHCIRHRAKFVCCPCCYGQCNEMPHISYPRSKFFRKNDIQLNDYLCIAHCADQAHSLQKTHNKIKSNQGQLCMDIIDTDRKFYTEEFGYRTTLTRLDPEDCTPKNRLLIGVI